MTNYYAYENDRLTFINSNNSVGYKFTYDNFGRTLKNEVGNGTEFRTLSTMYYDKYLLIGQAYDNGDYIKNKTRGRYYVPSLDFYLTL